MLLTLVKEFGVVPKFQAPEYFFGFWYCFLLNTFVFSPNGLEPSSPSKRPHLLFGLNYSLKRNASGSPLPLSAIASRESTPMKNGVPALPQGTNSRRALYSIAGGRDTMETKKFQDVGWRQGGIQFPQGLRCAPYQQSSRPGGTLEILGQNSREKSCRIPRHRTFAGTSSHRPWTHTPEKDKSLYI